MKEVHLVLEFDSDGNEWIVKVFANRRQAETFADVCAAYAQTYPWTPPSYVSDRVLEQRRQLRLQWADAHPAGVVTTAPPTGHYEVKSLPLIESPTEL